MYSTRDIYIEFRKAQSYKNGRAFRIPKDFDKHLTNKMNKTNRDALEMLTKYFNTKWSSIDPLNYFECGFELYKTFSYNLFFEPKIITLYKQRDKNKKRDIQATKESIAKSIAFIKEYMKENDLKSIKEYYRKRDGYKSVIVDHYLHNKLNGQLLAHLINEGKVQLNDEDRAMVPYIVENYRKLLSEYKEVTKDV